MMKPTLTTRSGWLIAGLLLAALIAGCTQPVQAPAPTVAPTAVAKAPAPTIAPPAAPTAAPTSMPPTAVPTRAATVAPTAVPATAVPTAPPKKLNVVATNSILADLAKNIAGTAADVTSLLAPGADPHTFQPAPRDSQTVARADVIIENGVGLEEWLTDLIKGSGTKAKTVVASKDLKLRESEEEHDDHDDDKKTPAPGATPAKDDHAHAFDPHLWMDVQNTMTYVENIRDGLSAADPANAATYKANADKYLAQLKELDAYIVQQTATIPQARRKLVTNHDTFGYFAERYGFEVVGSVIPSVSAEAQPSAQDIARLLTAIKDEGVPAIFTESTVSPRLAEQLARDAKVTVVSDLFTDSLSEAGKAADTYLKMMRYNIDQIVKALK